MLRQQDELPRLNYLWVGPPRTAAGPVAELGSDVIDVIATARRTKNPVCYYCLDKHTAHYKKIFKAHHVDVRVQSIDETLKDGLHHGNENIRRHAATLIAIKAELLKIPRDRIVDRVIFKDVFSLFLLASEGGYTLDTSVKLNEDVKDVMFAAHENFKAPTMKVDTECWMMYASPQALQQPMAMLENYLSKWDGIQNIIRGNQNIILKIIEYHHKVTGLIIDSIVAGTSAIKKDPAWEFELVIPEKGPAVASLHGLPITKTYSGGHKPEYECRVMIGDAVRQFIQKKSSIDREERHSLLLIMKAQLEKYEGMTDLLDIHLLNLALDAALKAVTELDRQAMILGKISSDYSSKSSDPEKLAFAEEINRAINNTYYSLREILNMNKGNLPKKINVCIDAFKEHIQVVAQQAQEYHQEKYLFARKQPATRFAEVKNAIQHRKSKN